MVDTVFVFGLLEALLQARHDMKALWAVVLLFGAPVSMPIFWYLYVWRQHHLPASPAVA